MSAQSGLCKIWKILWQQTFCNLRRLCHLISLKHSFFYPTAPFVESVSPVAFIWIPVISLGCPFIHVCYRKVLAFLLKLILFWWSGRLLRKHHIKCEHQTVSLMIFWNLPLLPQIKFRFYLINITLNDYTKKQTYILPYIAFLLWL